jgi:hypothetical protein
MRSLRVITNLTVNPPESGKIKNVLVYWDRGTLAWGDHGSHQQACYPWTTQDYPNPLGSRKPYPRRYHGVTTILIAGLTVVSEALPELLSLMPKTSGAAQGYYHHIRLEVRRVLLLEPIVPWHGRCSKTSSSLPPLCLVVDVASPPTPMLNATKPRNTRREARESLRSLGETTTTILAEMDLLMLAVLHKSDVLRPHCSAFRSPV